MKISYIDTFSNATGHAQFNAALLLMCYYAFGELKYYAGKSSRTCIYSLLKAYNLEKIQQKNIYVVSGHSRISLLFRYFISAFQNIRLLVGSSKSEILVYNFNNLFSIRFINWLNKILHRKIVIFCHGEIELLVANPHLGGILHKTLAFLVKNFFNNPSVKFQKDIHFIIMGDVLLKNLEKEIPKDNVSHFLVLDHSYIFSDTKQNNSRNTGLSLGTVGVFDIMKGGDYLVKLAEKLQKKNLKEVTLSIIGRIFYDIQVLKKYGILLPDKEGKVSLTSYEFNKEIKKLDYILFFYPPDSYQLTASGAVMDAINLSKPIIALRNDYFQYLFDKYGSFGYLVNDLDEMVSIIDNLVNRPDKGLLIDFDTLRLKLSPQILYKDLLVNFQQVVASK